jgi:hypothetical protein
MDDGPHSSSDSDEHDLQTPSYATYPDNLQYPFGVSGGQQGGKDANAGLDMMDVVAQPTVGLMGPEGKLHG